MIFQKINFVHLLTVLGLLLSTNLSACSSRAVVPQVGAPIAPGELGFYTIDSVKYPKSTCNDGSPGAFVFRRGQGEGANKWVLILQGGGACGSPESCTNRSQELKSSIPWERESLDEIWGLFDGIVSTDLENNPHFYNWNHVVFIYCSSDSWLGQRTASAESGGLHFRGHFIIEAIIDALQDQDLIGSPSLSAAEDVLLAGSSAGAGGVRGNVDWVGELLQSYAIEAKFRGVLDAGVGPLTNPGETFDAPGSSRTLWQAFVDQDCVAALAEKENPGICSSAEYLLTGGYV